MVQHHSIQSSSWRVWVNETCASAYRVPQMDCDTTSATSFPQWTTLNNTIRVLNTRCRNASIQWRGPQEKDPTPHYCIIIRHYHQLTTFFLPLEAPSFLQHPPRSFRPSLPVSYVKRVSLTHQCPSSEGMTKKYKDSLIHSNIHSIINPLMRRQHAALHVTGSDDSKAKRRLSQPPHYLLLVYE